MEPFTLDNTCSPWLEDEVLLIEHVGEMPEVALAESLHLLGELPPEDLYSLRAACARGYLRNIKRDLDPANIGSPAFRGLARALANLARLKRFLSGFGAELPVTAQGGLATALEDFLQAEQNALDQGRLYSAAPPGEVTALAGALAYDLEPWQDLLGRVENLPARAEALGLHQPGLQTPPSTGGSFAHRTHGFGWKLPGRGCLALA